MPGFEIVVDARSEDFDPDDRRWRAQVGTLVSDLHEQVEVTTRGEPGTGTKGAVEALVLALGSAGAFTAAVECFRAWLGRDRSRRLAVRWDEDGVQHTVTLTGDAVDSESVRIIAAAAARRIGGPAWPADTGPS